MKAKKLNFERRPLPGEWVSDASGARYEVVSCGMRFVCVKRPSGATMLLAMGSLMPCSPPSKDEVKTA